VNVNLLGCERSRLELAPTSQGEEVDILVGLIKDGLSTGNRRVYEAMLLTSIPCFFSREKIDCAPLEIVRF
jgi:hypothetical protein